MIHLYGRGDVLTICGLTSALPGSLTTEIENVTCRYCRMTMIAQGQCPECGERDTLRWDPHPKKLTTVVDGRLTMNDVTAVFYLACDCCSETLIPEVDLDAVAKYLTENRFMP